MGVKGLWKWCGMCRFQIRRFVRFAVWTGMGWVRQVLTPSAGLHLGF